MPGANDSTQPRIWEGGGVGQGGRERGERVRENVKLDPHAPWTLGVACQVRINGRSAAKVCQGAKVPGGATRKITLTLDNP